jgi:predicted nucleic acid-binding protein
VSAGRVQIIDTCVLLNLLASGEIEGILRAAARASLVCSAVEKESLYLRSENPKNPLEPVNLAPLIKAGLLQICEIEGPEEEVLYVDYSSLLDDGEAMSLAIAVARGLDLSTDERKARRLFLEAVGQPTRLISTAEMIRGWAESEHVPATRVRAGLLQIQERARYQPGTADGNYQWWIGLCI